MKRVIKYTTLAVITASLLVFTSCKSTKKADKGAAAATGDVSVTASDMTDNKVSEEDEEKQEAAADGETSEKTAEKSDAEATESKDAAQNVQNGNFTGWIKGTRRSISEKYGRVQLKIK